MQCVNCGLLAMRKKSDASLAEVPGYIREKDPTTRTAVVNKFEDEHEITPVCLARQATFSPKKEEYSEQFKEERDCESFFPWEQGFSPREHKEMAMHETDRQWKKEALVETRNYTLLSAAIGFSGAVIASLITIAAGAIGAVITYAFMK